MKNHFLMIGRTIREPEAAPRNPRPGQVSEKLRGEWTEVFPTFGTLGMVLSLSERRAPYSATIVGQSPILAPAHEVEKFQTRVYEPPTSLDNATTSINHILKGIYPKTEQ